MSTNSATELTSTMSSEAGWGTEDGAPAWATEDGAPAWDTEDGAPAWGPQDDSPNIWSNTDEFVVGIFYWPVFVIGTLGNLFVLVVMGSPQGRKVTQGHHATSRVFLVSLSSADLLLNLTSSWVDAVDKMTPSDRNWPYGKGFCKVHSFVRVFSCYTSLYTLAAIAVERYLVISRKNKKIITYRRAIIICVVIWVFNCLINIPWFYWSTLITLDPSTTRCTFYRIADRDLLSWYSIVTRLTNFFIPLGLTWLAYGLIVYVMYSSSKKVTSEVTTSTKKSTWRVARMCLVVVLCFTITWTPFQIIILYISNISVTHPLFHLAHSLVKIFLLLASANSCINPFIYGIMWKPFKVAVFKDIIKDQIWSKLDSIRHSKIIERYFWEIIVEKKLIDLKALSLLTGVTICEYDLTK